MKKTWLPRRLRCLAVCMVTICLLLSALAPAASATSSTPVTKHIYFSLSKDGQPLLTKVPIDVPYFPLENYGLEEFNRYVAAPFEEGGQYLGTSEEDLVQAPTVLHALLKAHERIWGSAFNSGSMSEYFTVSGSATSMFITSLFKDVTYNLMYFVDHSYPLMAPNWGATADYILLEDGMTIEFGIFSDIEFYSRGAFLLFDQDDYYLTPTSTREVHVYRTPTVPDESGGTAPTTGEEDAYFEIYKISGTGMGVLDSESEGGGCWEYVGNPTVTPTDSTGAATIDLSSCNLQVGQTYVLAAFGDATCEVPAYSTLHIVNEIPTLSSISLSAYGTADDPTILYPSQTLQLEPVILAENADCTLTWASSNTDALRITPKGFITAQNVSTTTDVTVTCTATSGSTTVSDSCVVRILAGIPVTNVALNHNYVEMSLNGTCQLSATITPSNASSTVVDWTSTNYNNVHVNHLGLVTAKANGVETITAESAMSTTTHPLKDTCRVAVGGKFGDANGDGVVNAADISAVEQMIEDEVTGGTYFAYVDMDGNGVLTSNDVSLIQQIIDEELVPYVQQ